MILCRLVLHSDPEARASQDRLFQEIAPGVEGIHWHVKNRQLHAAGDVDSHRIRNHRILTSQHAANRQTVANMRIGHQRRANGARHSTSLTHLRVGPLVNVFAPSGILDGLGGRFYVHGEKVSRQIAPHGILQKSLRTLQHTTDQLLRPFAFQTESLAGLCSTAESLHGNFY